VICVLPALALFGEELFGHVIDVVTRITALRKRFFQTTGLQVASAHGATQNLHLNARVVHIVFAVHGVAGRLKHATKRIARRGTATMTDMQRACGICRDELDLHAFACTEFEATIIVACLKDLKQPPTPSSRTKRKV
jgi:hypothetical protein